ncbi:MAG TPA: GTP cyclohydrolase II [Xanthobacteraceae bacterium]|nr:GTP cyclohydrolase II [Xanthobacteraceae bacterium]
MTVMPVDGLTDQGLASFRLVCAPARPHLLITARRARALGLDGGGPTGLAIGDLHNAAALLSLAADTQVTRHLDVVPAGDTAGAAIELAKLAQRLPALLVGDGTAAGVAACDPPLMAVAADAVAQFRQAAIASLVVAAEATIPLHGGFSARFVIFRDGMGGAPVAIVVGRPDLAQPVPVRLHSACLTGDVFGSRRCDCGDQLRLALPQLAQQGGGIILYLEQEGRGLGLANKIRTYQLQDAGLDTVDANTVLGFDDDERDYGIAVRMLQVLGCTRVRLLTNNPAKLDGLSHAGIDVSGRVPLQGPINSDNRRYLTAKARRAGHKLDHVLGALAEAGESPRDG